VTTRQALAALAIDVREVAGELLAFADALDRLAESP